MATAFFFANHCFSEKTKKQISVDFSITGSVNDPIRKVRGSYTPTRTGSRSDEAFITTEQHGRARSPSPRRIKANRCMFQSRGALATQSVKSVVQKIPNDDGKRKGKRTTVSNHLLSPRNCNHGPARRGSLTLAWIGGCGDGAFPCIEER